jgi:hypothetical protein
MELKAIEKLLNKYLEGETSLKDEAILRTYFTQESRIPEAWIPYRQFFGYCKEAKKETFPVKQKKQTKPIKSWMLVAASIALVFALQLSGLFEQKAAPFEKQQAELAFQQFQTQMKTVSNHLNRGAQKVAYLDYWNDTTQKLIK